MDNDLALQIFTGLRFVDYELGDPPFIGADAPGIVFICCELATQSMEETRFKLLAYKNERYSVLALANTLLAQKWDCNSKVYARLHVERDPQKRATKMQAIEHLSNKPA
jgi:hypothetical protein